MNDGPDLLDTAYEYGGFQAAGAFQEALSGLSIPLLFALAGTAWRVFRVAEDGAVRPLAFHFLSMLFIAWLATPRSSEPSALPHLRAPRALGMIDAATDALVRRAIEGVNRDFLKRPFEWERLAILARHSTIQDGDLSEAVGSFVAECVPAAILRAGSPPPDGARRNPLADDSGLSYENLVDASGRSCETLRRSLLSSLRQEVERHPVHKEALAALAAYDGGSDPGLTSFYLDKLVRNRWFHRAAPQGEGGAVAASLGTYRWFDVDRTTTRIPYSLNRNFDTWYDIVTFPGVMVGEIVTNIYAETSQWVSEATESKQRYYAITKHAPHLYGLTLMLLMALFPLAALYALLPGKWTALLQFAKVAFSVKLWPFGWALLTSFTERRPSVLALADATSDLGAHVQYAFRLGEDPNLFASIVLMYFLVPAIAFCAVQLVSHAASLPFQSAIPKPAGGNVVGAAGKVAAVATE
jgi:hypothetical protein